MTEVNFEDLREKVLEWAGEKQLLDPKFAHKQYEKFAEEVGEFEEAWKAYEKDSTPDKRVDMILEYGDVLVTLIILAGQLRIDPSICLKAAYLKIKDRKGKTIDGTFVKSEDLKDD